MLRLVLSYIDCYNKVNNQEKSSYFNQFEMFRAEYNNLLFPKQLNPRKW